MPDSVILVDFGASRIKAVHWTLASGCVIASRECASPVLRYGSRGEAEGDPEHYWQALEATAGQIVATDPGVQDLWLCTEMHGFILVDPQEPKPVTPYISWQDQRASHKSGQEPSILERLSPHGSSLLAEAGIRLRPGLPIVNLATMRAEANRSAPARFLTLADWLLVRGGERLPRCHPTLAAGTGLYSLNERDWSPALMRLAGIDPNMLFMSAILAESTLPVGTIRLHDRPIRVWGGLGDLQAAAHGAGFPQTSSILINLGTGSQVMALTPVKTENIEVRPCAQGELAHAITHIPSGRALNTYASFIDDCVRIGGGQPLFWRTFAELTAEEVLEAEAAIDLNVFHAAWRYTKGGSITQIVEGNFDLRWLMRTLAKSWLVQYQEALTAISAEHPSPTFLLCGGLSRRSSFIPQVLESLLGKQAIEWPSRTGEETLDGLLKLAESSYRNKSCM
jgi:sugar (pentulose or hexulose) kinase